MMNFEVKTYPQLRELCKCMAFLYANASEETKKQAAKQYPKLIPQEESFNATTRRESNN